MDKLKQLLFGTKKVRSLLPGILLAVVLMMVSVFLSKISSQFLGFEKNLISPILLAIVLGVLIRSIVSLPDVFNGGIDFGIKKLLRFGIILMGIRLSIFEVLKIGSVAFFLITVCIAGALIITLFLAKKIGISSKLGALIAAGTSICGVSAIVAVSPAIDAKENETTYAIGVITLFGIAATLFYPYLTQLVFQFPVVHAGFFMGTSVHDTSQVAATSLIYDQLWANKSADGLSGADVAIVTKLIRNTFMIVVIPILGFWFGQKKEGKKRKVSVVKYVPLFVFGYILMGIGRTVGDYIWQTDEQSWVDACEFIKTCAAYTITVAIGCIGLKTDIKKLFLLGYKPLICGLISALSVGLISWGLISLFGKYLSF